MNILLLTALVCFSACDPLLPRCDNVPQHVEVHPGLLNQYSSQTVTKRVLPNRRAVEKYSDSLMFDKHGNLNFVVIESGPTEKCRE